MESTALKYNTDIDFAMEMDANDKLASYREEFFHPVNAEGKEKIYLSGNSLGLQPVATPNVSRMNYTAGKRWDRKRITRVICPGVHTSNH